MLTKTVTAGIRAPEDPSPARCRCPALQHDTAEYKHVVPDLIFLKCISDAFEEQQARVEAEVALGAGPEDPDEYRVPDIFWMPQEAR